MECLRGLPGLHEFVCCETDLSYNYLQHAVCQRVGKPHRSPECMNQLDLYRTILKLYAATITLVRLQDKLPPREFNTLYYGVRDQRDALGIALAAEKVRGRRRR